MSDLAIVGRIRRPHGIRGEVIVELHTDEPDVIFASGRRVFVGTEDGERVPDGRELVVRSSRPFKDTWIVAFEGPADRNAVEAWRDWYLLVPAEELTPPAEGEIFLHDLVGMRAELADGEVVGDVVAYYEAPQGILLEIRRPTGSALVPFHADIVTEVDVEARRLVIAPPEGLLE